MQARDEVRILLFFDDLLKLERKSTSRTVTSGVRPNPDLMKSLLAGDLNFVRFHNVLKRGHVPLCGWSLSTYLDDDDKCRLEERRIYSRI